MQSDHKVSPDREPVEAPATNAPRPENSPLAQPRLEIFLASFRGFFRRDKLELLKEGFERSTHWAHTTTALFVFASDFLKPLISLCTVWLATTAVFLAILLILAIRYRLIPTKTASSFLVFCSITAVLSLLMMGLQAFIGEKDGALASLIPGVEQLQERLGVLDATLNAVKRDAESVLKGQEQAEARAEARQAELKRLLAATVVGAPAVQALADIRDLLRPAIPR